MASNFDPDAYLAQTSTAPAAFDPDAYLSGTAGSPTGGADPNLPDTSQAHVDPLSFERGPNYPNAKMTDATVPDLAMVQGIGGLAKGALGLGVRGAGAALNAMPLTENIVPSIGDTADDMLLKSIGTSAGQIKAGAKALPVGEALESARDAAKVGRQAGLDTVFSTERGRTAGLQDLLSSEGKNIGDLRQQAGQASPDILSQVEKNLTAKYNPAKADVFSGESPQIQQGINTIRNASKTSSLPVIEPGSKVGEPHALFAYNDQLSPEMQPVSKYQVFGDPNSPVFKSGQLVHGSQATADQLQAAGVDITGRTPRSVGKWEPLDVSNADISKGITNLNRYNAGAKALQPVNALTDVANQASKLNNADIMSKLSPADAAKYVKSLQTERGAFQLAPMMERGLNREAVARMGRGVIQGTAQKAMDAGGYRAASSGLDALHGALSNTPAMTPTAKAAMEAYLAEKYNKRGNP